MTTYPDEPKTVAELMDRYRAVKRRLHGDPRAPRKDPDAEQAETTIAVVIAVAATLARRAHDAELRAQEWKARTSGCGPKPKTLPPATPATARAIVKDVAQRTGVPVEEIFGRTRTGDVALARHEAIWRIKKATDWSLPRIGRMFNRDHTTVLNSIRRMEAQTAASITQH